MSAIAYTVAQALGRDPRLPTRSSQGPFAQLHGVESNLDVITLPEVCLERNRRSRGYQFARCSQDCDVISKQIGFVEEVSRVYDRSIVLD